MLLALFALIGLPVQALLVRVSRRAPVWFAQIFWRGIAAILGLKIRCLGAPVARARPALFIANHSTWLDIVALGAVLPGAFVAKSEINGWPFVGFMARLGRTEFVSRGRATLHEEQKRLGARMAAGDDFILFPEGTTSDGNRVLPFHASFLTLAFGEARPTVQPVAVVYDELDGLPVRRGDRPMISWHGDMPLAPHALALLKRQSLRATLWLGEPIAPGTLPDRKALGRVLEAQIGGAAGALRQSRTPNAPEFS
ncbi:1-acyl-sn-glycerol-3-phosphate acyltransferase [Acidocella sp.]|uniref:lysophospholipid acyltransferase family protein n=1 Tax=Acidocella sp. TaxID=50710 RepID=UPI00262C68EC|nr:lysophospholipid acyltransferase family protein [Acidocella sp.]